MAFVFCLFHSPMLPWCYMRRNLKEKNMSQLKIEFSSAHRTKSRHHVFSTVQIKTGKGECERHGEVDGNTNRFTKQLLASFTFGQCMNYPSLSYGSKIHVSAIYSVSKPAHMQTIPMLVMQAHKTASAESHSCEGCHDVMSAAQMMLR